MALPAIAAAAIPAIAGLFGGERRNRVDQREAQKNRDFQERMRNTAWQSAVEDMRAAGLNPALAYSQGPAASPGGSTPGPALDTVSSAMQAMQMRKSLQLLDAQVDEREAVAEREKARTSYLLGRSSIAGRPRPPLLHDLIDAEISSVAGAGASARSVADYNAKRASILGPQAELFESLTPLIKWFTQGAEGTLKRFKR